MKNPVNELLKTHLLLQKVLEGFEVNNPRFSKITKTLLRTFMAHVWLHGILLPKKLSLMNEINKEHKELERLLNALIDAPPKDAKKLATDVAVIRTIITAHFKKEAEHFYPAVEKKESLVMNKKLTTMLVFTVFTLTQTHIWAASPVAAPLYQVTVVQTPAKAINYRNLKGSTEIDFKGTVLIPAAKGIAAIKNKAGVTEIKAEFENITPPMQFGAEYLTYVFWAISPDGRATNLGELIIKDGKGALNAKTPLQALTLLVSAEPYFAVSQPSNVVILENAIKPDNKDKIELVDAKYELLPRGQYTKNLSATDLQPQVMDKKTPFNVYQARNAVKIAKAAGAETYAVEGFKNSERLLALSETKAGGKKGRSMTAREAVQSAEDARSITVKRQADEALTSATIGQANAESAQAKAEMAKDQSDTERATAMALASSANDRVQKVEGEKGVLRAQLYQQLNAVLQTRDTARGLIVNMSDALFQTGSATLRPAVREKLAKIAGIVASHPGLKLAVEGHTDSVGSEDANQRLSEKRAQAARDYLVGQGVAADSITSRGFGKNSPLESNDTAEGRSKNRRVEMIVSGDSIGTSALAQ